MGIDSHFTKGQRGLKKKAKTHNPTARDGDEMPPRCAACHGSHRAHTCGKGRTLPSSGGASRLQSLWGGGASTALPQPSEVTLPPATRPLLGAAAVVAAAPPPPPPPAPTLPRPAEDQNNPPPAATAEFTPTAGGGGGGSANAIYGGVVNRSGAARDEAAAEANIWALVPGPVKRKIEELRATQIPELSSNGKLQGGANKVAAFTK